MLTTKQRVYLRSLAQTEPTTFQIGKDGLNDNMLTDVINYLNKHEIIKISVLQNSNVEPEDVISFFAVDNVEFVQHIGRVFVFYMHSDNAKDPIELPIK